MKTLRVNLAAFVKEIDLPAPIYFQRRANVWLKRLRSLAFENGLLPLNVADVSLDFLDVLRGEANIRNGVVLTRLDIAKKILEKFPDKEIVIEEPTEKHSVAELAQLLDDKRISFHASSSDLLLRFRLYAHKMRREIFYLRTKTRIPTLQGERRLFVLPRLVSHIQEVLPVVNLLKEKHGIQILFGVVTNGLAEMCRREGCDYINLIESDSQLKRQARETEEKLSSFLKTLTSENFNDEFTLAEIEAMKIVTKQIVHGNLFYSLRVAKGVVKVFDEFQPSLFFACNPYIMEGRAAIYIAKKYGVKIVSSEHGSIFPNDPIWQDCLCDLVCVYGEPSRRTLLTCGVREEQIAVTGAPRFDKIHETFTERNIRKEEANILVATSGPGDQVSLEQHQRFINVLYEASSLAPNLRWVVKLHAKDRKDFYTKVAEKFPSSRIEVVSGEQARFGADIFDYLAAARCLVTICSTTALDAMLVDVPVIAVALESKEKGLQGIEFLDKGCALRVESAKELAETAHKIWQGKKDERVESSAKRYINEHYANLGCATEKVAEKLLSLMKGSLEYRL